VRILLEARANPNASVPQASPLAQLYGPVQDDPDNDYNVVRQAFAGRPTAPESITPLVIAVVQDKMASAIALLRGGADVNAPVHGIPPLFMAAAAGNTKMVELLFLKFGAELYGPVTIGDRRFESALELAIASVQLETVTFLAEVGRMDPLAGELRSTIAKCAVMLCPDPMRQMCEDGERKPPDKWKPRKHRGKQNRRIIKHLVRLCMGRKDAPLDATELANQFRTRGHTRIADWLAKIKCNGAGPHSPCRRAGGRKCERCGVARYCCKEHQLADWPEHKHSCRKID